MFHSVLTSYSSNEGLEQDDTAWSSPLKYDAVGTLLTSLLDAPWSS